MRTFVDTDYCHGRIERREFLARAAALSVAGASALAMAESLLPRYAEAQTISFNDERIRGLYVDYPSPGGTSGQMRGYLVQPAGDGPFASVLVIHENRGLNPYIEDVARRVAIEGMLALAPDGLAPIGGYPGNDDDGRAMQKTLDQAELRQDMVNSARYLKAHPLSSGKLGATGFCWGGGTTNFLAVTDAGVPFYGRAPDPGDVAKIRAPLLVHYAEDDERVNAMRPAFEAALQANDADYEMHTYRPRVAAHHGLLRATPRLTRDMRKPVGVR
jgi:carboxymethylenebutenolidase